MGLFHNRPLAISCFCFVLCALLSVHLEKHFLLICFFLSLITAIFFLVLYLTKKKKQLFLAFLCVLAILLSIGSSYSFFVLQYQKYQSLIGSEVCVEGTVIKRLYSVPYNTLYQAKVNQINGEECDIQIKLSFDYASSLQPGEVFRIQGTGVDFTSEESYDEELQAISEGIVLTVNCKDYRDCEILDVKNDIPQVVLSRWNEALSYRLQSAVGGAEGGLASALLLGNRDLLDPNDELSFRRTGVSHILALSGLHVSILIAFVDWFFQKCHCPKFPRVIIITVLSFGYLFLTGYALSTCRAVLMLMVLSISFCLRASYDSFTALTFSLVVILFVSPYSVMDIGMWMSYIAAASIVIFLPACQWIQDTIYEAWTLPVWIFKLLVSFLSAIFVGVVANLGLMLLQGIVFQEVSLFSVPTTLLLSVPLTATLVTAIFSLFLPPLAPACTFCGKVMRWIASEMAAVDDIVVSFNNPITITLTVVLTLALILLAIVKLRSIWWGILPLLLCVATILSSFMWVRTSYEGVRLQYVGNERGAILLFTENDRSVAVNIAPGKATRSFQLIELLEASGCTELDDLIFTHYHNTDAYFIHKLTTAIRVHTIHFPTPYDEQERITAMRLEEEAALHGVSVCYDLNDLAIECLQINLLEHCPVSTSRHDAVLFSASVRDHTVTYANCGVPDTALLEKAREFMRVSDILIFGANGYSTASDTKFPVPSSETNTIIISAEKVLRLIPNFSNDILLLNSDEVREFFFR